MVERVVFIVLDGTTESTPKQKRKENALELAELIYDMFAQSDKIEEEGQE